MPARLIVKAGKEKKLRNFYPFIYKDEISGIMGNCKNGDIVDIVDDKLNFVGRGYYGENSHIVGRVLTTKDEEIDKKFIDNKIKNAKKRRVGTEKETNAMRIFFSEADGLSGLIADMFEDYISVQFRTPGIENFKKEIINSFKKHYKPKGIYERSDVETRIKEGTDIQKGILFGEIPDRIIMNDNGLKYNVDVINGQKTGFFLDQRESRKFIRPYLNSEMKFLDVFSSSGGFSVAALKEGCKKVVAIDKSAEALDLAKENYSLNVFDGEFETICGDAFEELKKLQGVDEKYDVIVLDPPALVKTKSENRKGRDLFKRLCDDSFKIISENGILGVCTCAYHISLQDLVEVTRMAASDNGKKLQVLGVSYQPQDHPWILHIPETLYLKCLWVQIVDGQI